MKRILCIIASLTLLASIFAPLSVFAEEPIKISMFVQVDASDGPQDEAYLWRYIEEKWNVEFEITEINSSVWDEKIALAFATDSYPDFIPEGITDLQAQTYGSQGILIDLYPYLTDENAPTLYNYMQTYDEYRLGLMTYDGYIYRLQGFNKSHEREYMQARFFLNKQWAANLGMEVPSTLDEFYEYLKAVKEGDADLDGDPNNEIPMSGGYDSDPMSLLTVVLSAYGIPLSYGYNDIYTTIDDSGNVVFVPTMEYFKEALAFMNKLYTEGLLDASYFTQSSDQVDAKIASCEVGCFMDWAHWLNITDPENYQEWDGITPLTSEYNDTPIWPSDAVKLQGGACITDKCENVETLISILDWASSFEGVCTMWGGEEVDPEGTEAGYYVQRLDELYGCDARSICYIYDTDKYATVTAWQNAEIAASRSILPFARVEWKHIESAASEQALDSALMQYVPYGVVGWPNTVKFSTEENDQLTLLSADIESYLDQMVAKFIIGDESLDSFESFVQGLYDRGLEQYLKIYQEAYNRYIAM